MANNKTVIFQLQLYSFLFECELTDVTVCFSKLTQLEAFCHDRALSHEDVCISKAGIVPGSTKKNNNMNFHVGASVQ